MAFNYTPLQTKAAALLERFGSSVTLRYDSGGTVDRARATASVEPTENTITANGVLTQYKNREIDGESIKASDMKLIIENVATEPEPGWTVTAGSRLWRIVDVMPINPGGTNLIYICQVRV